MSAEPLFEFDSAEPLEGVFQDLLAIWKTAGYADISIEDHATSEVLFGAGLQDSGPAMPEQFEGGINDALIQLVAAIEAACPSPSTSASSFEPPPRVEDSGRKPYLCRLGYFTSSDELPLIVQTAARLLRASTGSIYYYRDPHARWEAHDSPAALPSGFDVGIRVHDIFRLPPDMSDMSHRYVIQRS